MASRGPETELKETVPHKEIRRSDLAGLAAEDGIRPPHFPTRKKFGSFTAAELDRTRYLEAQTFRDIR